MQQRFRPALLLLLCVAAPCFAAGDSAAHGAEPVHPVERVISLLKSLSTKAELEGQAEEITYAKFETWCANSVKSLAKAVEEEKAAMDVLKSTITAKTQDEAAFKGQVSFLEAEILKHEGADTAAETMREEAAQLYASADADLEATISAISDAVSALESAEEGTQTVGALAQIRTLVTSPLILEQLTSSQRQLLLGSIAGSEGRNATEGVLAGGDLDAHTARYTFKSHTVVGLLKELKEKFENDRLEGTKAETNSINAYELAKNARASALQAANVAKTAKEAALLETSSALAAAKTSLENTEADYESDSSSLADTQRSCALKKSEWTERSGIRAHELKAMAAGITILSKVTGVRISVPENPVPPPSPISFLQRGPLSQNLRAPAMNLLREKARGSHSKVFDEAMEAICTKAPAACLAAKEVAARVTGTSPFGEVNNMIQKMIFRLMAEQKDEDDHKNWCDLELEKSNSSKVSKEGKLESIGAKLEEGKATVALLADEILEANGMVATLTSHLQEAAEIRQAGKTENELAVQDSKDAQAAIAQATAVLEAFYKESGMVAKEPWEFLQAPVELPEEPSTWAASYTGISDPSNQPYGIITLLKDIAASFAKMEADTMAQEETDQKAFDEEKKSCEIEKARRAKESEIKEEEKKRLLERIDALEKSEKHVEEELGAVEQYLSDLQPACVEGDSTYEARKASRSQEIAGLKQAQVILADYAKGPPSSAAAPAPAPPSAAFLAPIRPVRHP